MGRHLSPRYGQVILVRGTLLWQLSIDHNIDVQSVSFWAPKVVRKCESKHWLSCDADRRRAGGQSVYDYVITKFSGMGRFTKLWGSAHALRARVELRYDVTYASQPTCVYTLHVSRCQMSHKILHKLALACQLC